MLNSSEDEDEEDPLGAELEEREQEIREMARMGLRINEGFERTESEEAANETICNGNSDSDSKLAASPLVRGLKEGDD